MFNTKNASIFNVYFDGETKCASKKLFETIFKSIEAVSKISYILWDQKCDWLYLYLFIITTQHVNKLSYPLNFLYKSCSSPLFFFFILLGKVTRTYDLIT